MTNPAAAADSDDASYPAFVCTAEEIEAPVELLIARTARQARDERSADAHR